MKNRTESSPEARTLREGHRQRLRLRMEREGWASLKPYEMVELVLCHAVPRQDVSNLARLLVDRFETVGGVFSASRAQLLRVPGMTPSLSEWVVLTGELMRAYRDAESVRGIRLSCCQEVLAFIRSRLAQMGGSRAWALYADFDFCLITWTALGDREDWWDAANVRDMIVEALGNGARYLYLVLARQDMQSSPEDEFTARLSSIATTLSAVDLDLVDCLLVEGEHIRSLRVQGSLVPEEPGEGSLSLHERYLSDT